MQLSRRELLAAAGATGALAVGTTTLAYGLPQVLRRGAANPTDGPGQAASGVVPPVTERTLVVVTLYGGNDGLNTVVPAGDRVYQDARGALAWKPEEVLDLDGTAGFNPALKRLHGLYKGGKAAVVRGAGYPKPDHSHFRSMDIWQSAVPERPVTTGWLGRWLDAQGADPLHALSFNSSLPLLLTGARTAAASVIEGAKKAQVPAKLAAPSSDDSPLMARAAKAFADLQAVDAKIEELPDDPMPPAGQGAGTGTGGRGQLDKQLDMAARCIEARLPTRVYAVSLGGFDTHATEKDTHRQLLAQLDGAVGAFMERMARTPAGNGVVVVIYSEFGRRVKANGSGGTDHGTASDVLVLGNPVKGGMYGAPASLTDLDDGDLKFTTDFRDLYAAVLSGVLGAEPARFLEGWKGSVAGLFR